MDDSRVRWSDLPAHLWPVIGKRLDTYTDVVRFRSVCRSWRASLPPSDAISPPLPIDVPSPVNVTDRPTDVLLFRRIIYRLSPLDHDQSSNSTSSFGTEEGWLAKVESKKLGKMRFLHPLSGRYFRHKHKELRRKVNLLDFGIYEVAKSYTLGFTNGTLVPGITKVVMFPDSPWTDLMMNCTIIAVYAKGKLGFTKLGDDKWTLIEDNIFNFRYDDVIVYKGQFYAVNRWGTVFWIDSSMRLVQFSPPLCGFGDQKHLVECGGELYVVDRFLAKEPMLGDVDFVHNRRRSKVVDLKVYRLDQEWGRWVEVNDLGNQAFVLGNDCCFSISAPDFEGLKGSCIYFTCAPKRTNYTLAHVFDLQERCIFRAFISLPSIWLVDDYESDSSNNSYEATVVGFAELHR